MTLRVPRMRAALLLLSTLVTRSSAMATAPSSGMLLASSDCLGSGAASVADAASGAAKAVAIAGLLGGNTLVPLAQYVRGQWVRTWPLPDEQVDRALRTVDQLPRAWYPDPRGLPMEWFLWTEELRGVPVPVGAPVLGEAHCQAVWGLSTPLLPLGHETTAIATNGQSGIQPFALSTLAGAPDPRLRELLPAEAEKAEIAAIRSKRSDADALLARRHDYDREYHLACATTAAGNSTLCSFETSRRLGSSPLEADPGCDDVVVVQGWLASSSGGVTALQPNVVLTDCDAKGLRTWAPLILVAAGARTFVVVREHGYEDESFVVFELRDGRPHRVLEVPGGGC